MPYPARARRWWRHVIPYALGTFTQDDIAQPQEVEEGSHHSQEDAHDLHRCLIREVLDVLEIRGREAPIGELRGLAPSTAPTHDAKKGRAGTE